MSDHSAQFSAVFLHGSPNRDPSCYSFTISVPCDCPCEFGRSANKRLLSRIETLEKEKQVLELKYIAVLEEPNKLSLEVASLSSKVDSLNSVIEHQQSELASLSEQLRKITAELELLKKDHLDRDSRLLLGELARAVEKELIRAVLGSDSKITSLTLMFKEAKQDTELNKRWAKLKQEIGWNNIIMISWGK